MAGARIGLVVVAAGLIVAWVPDAAGKTGDEAAWTMAPRDAEGSRFASDERVLRAANVGNLTLSWSFPTEGAVTGTPTVKDGRVFAATWKGVVYSLDAATGRLSWRHDNGAQVDASVALWDDLAFYGDSHAVLHALNETTGESVWNVTVDPTLHAHLYSNVIVLPQGESATLILGVGSDQESISIHGDAPIDFQGKVAALDARTGRILWRTALVDGNATGAPVWGTPIVDEDDGLVLLGTGNAYTEPAANTTDAIIALDLSSGAKRWSWQALAGDAWTQKQPSQPDADFGSTGSLLPTANGTHLFGIGQKSSVYRALDARSGRVVWSNGVATRGDGIIGASAYAEGLVIVPYVAQQRIAALDAATGSTVWSRPLGGRVYASPVIVPGAVIAGDSSGNVTAFDLISGAVLWNGSTRGAGGVFGGLSVAGGKLFVPTVETGFLGAHGSVLAFSPRAADTTRVPDAPVRPSAPLPPHEVVLQANAFVPEVLRVDVGTLVPWRNDDPFPHTVTSAWDDGATFDLMLAPGKSAHWTFDRPGTMSIVCTLHAGRSPDGTWRGMTQTIVVMGPPNATSPNDTAPGASADMGARTPGVGAWGALAALTGLSTILRRKTRR